MDNDVIIPGIGVGGMTEKYEIKILICYLLNSINHPLTWEQFNMIFQENQYVNYFAFCDALKELVQSKHVKIEQEKSEERYVLQPLGQETAQRLCHSLPSSLRDNVVQTAMRLLSRLKLEQENEVEIVPYQNGYMVRCIVHDTDFDLMRLEMFAPDEVQAALLKENFLADPSRTYRGIMRLLVEESL